MLDPAFVRDHLDEVRNGLRNRGVQPDASSSSWRPSKRDGGVDSGDRRAEARAERRGDEVARAKRQGKDASEIFAANKARAQQIRQLEIQLDQVEQQRARC
jgi:seryl-tRNA synthetase